MVDGVRRSWRFCLIFWLVTHAAYSFCQQCDVTNVHITHTDGKEHVLNVKHVKPGDCPGSKSSKYCYDGKKHFTKKSGAGEDDQSLPEGAYLFAPPDLKPIINMVFREMSPHCNKRTVKDGLPKALCTLREECCSTKAKPKLSKEILESYANTIFENGFVPYKSNDVALNKELAYGLVLLNTANYDDAIEKFSTIMKDHPESIGAYVGRASALSRINLHANYKLAVDDLSKAVSLDANDPELLIRRAEIEAPVGLHREALEDTNNAFKKFPDISMVYFRATVNLMGGDLLAAEQDFRFVLESENPELKPKALYYLSATMYMRGKVRNAIEVYLDLIKIDDNAGANIGIAQAYKAIGNYQQALSYFNISEQLDNQNPQVYLLRGTLQYESGNLLPAKQDFTTCLEISKREPSCLYMRGLVQSSLGQFYSAVKDYSKVLVYGPLTQLTVSPEVVQAQYMREWSRYIHSRLDTQISDFFLDSLPGALRHHWIKLQQFRFKSEYKEQPGLSPAISDVRQVWYSELSTPMQKLLCRAKKIGALTQVSADGHIPNRRLNVVMGLATIHVAQIMEKIWKGKKTQYDDDAISWRNLFAITSRYRKLVNPQLPIFWIDLMPDKLMQMGYTHNVDFLNGHVSNYKMSQYYSMVSRLMKTMVEHYEGDGLVNYAGFEEELESVDSPTGLLDIIRKRGINHSGFMLSTQVPSMKHKEKQGRLDGVVLTLAGHSLADTVLSMQIPVHKNRIFDFHVEMDHVFARLTDEIKRSGVAKISDYDGVTNLILSLAYYFYNLMPLSRGSSVVAYTVALGLLMSMGREVTGKIPPGRLMDIEAMLSGGPEVFTTMAKSWMNIKKMSAPVSELPDVEQVLSTPREILELINAAVSATC